MSNKEASRFISDVQNDPNFAEELTKLRGKPDDVYSLIKSKGYDVTTEEISAAYLEFASTCMTEEQLQNVAAGLTGKEKAMVAGGVTAGVAGGAIAFGVTIAIITTASATAAAAI